MLGVAAVAEGLPSWLGLLWRFGLGGQAGRGRLQAFLALYRRGPVHLQALESRVHAAMFLGLSRILQALDGCAGALQTEQHVYAAS